MLILDTVSYDDFDDSILKFRKRKGRRKPKVVRSVYEIKPGGAEGERDAKFADPDLQRLFERGFLSEVLFELPSGKEAVVYVVDGPMGKLAAKSYTDERVRTFKADDVYREGRFISRTRRKKAMAEAKRTGLTPEQILWVEEEYRQLKDFDEAGIPVPTPVAREGGVILMGYIGDDAPAPRLSEAALSPEEAEAAFKQSVDHLVKMLELGRVHGDYSAFNLLWWQGKVYVIDLPQVVMLERNKHARGLLERDVRSLLKSFKSLGVEVDPLEILGEVKRRAGYGAPPTAPGAAG
jgi:RIO kinase 1